MQDDAVLNWLQHWYDSNCDGEWEHNENIIITTIGNPGWSLTIKLEQTLMDGKDFLEIFIEKNETDWYCCRVRNNEFHGYGGVGNLSDLLIIFRDWASQCQI